MCMAHIELPDRGNSSREELHLLQLMHLLIQWVMCLFQDWVP